MAIWSKLFSLKKAEDNKIENINSCYKGELSNGMFRFKGIYGSSVENKAFGDDINLFVQIDVKKCDTYGMQNDDLYECIVTYSHPGRAYLGDNTSKEIFRGFLSNNEIKVFASFNIERMKRDQLYAEYVLRELFNRDYLIKIHNNTYIQNSNTSTGNYIGGIVETEDGLSIKLDEKIGELVDNSAYVIEQKESFKDILKKEKISHLHDKMEQIIGLRNKLKMDAKLSEFQNEQLNSLEESIRMLLNSLDDQSKKDYLNSISDSEVQAYFRKLQPMNDEETFGQRK